MKEEWKAKSNLWNSQTKEVNSPNARWLQNNNNKNKNCHHFSSFSRIDLFGRNLLSGEPLPFISHREFRRSRLIICWSLLFTPLTSQELQQNCVKHLADIMPHLKDLWGQVMNTTQYHCSHRKTVWVFSWHKAQMFWKETSNCVSFPK